MHANVACDDLLPGADGAKQTIMDFFEAFRQELDAHNDRKDRLIKLSRDATNLSKKVVFLLHRIAMEHTGDERQMITSVVQQSHKKLAEILFIFGQMQVDLQGENFWRFQKAVSGGIQEYIEALSFAHYLEHKTLVTFQQVQDNLRSSDGTPFLPLGLAYTDYILGISDLTGELMRFAITSIGQKGFISETNLRNATEICNFVRACRSAFEPMTPYITELKAKQASATNSLRKIEEAAYSVALRGIERSGLGGFGYVDPQPRDCAEELSVEKVDD